jgi:hypothetical protein
MNLIVILIGVVLLREVRAGAQYSIIIILG